MSHTAVAGLFGGYQPGALQVTTRILTQRAFCLVGRGSMNLNLRCSLGKVVRTEDLPKLAPELQKPSYLQLLNHIEA